jgi:hypothetical protein
MSAARVGRLASSGLDGGLLVWHGLCRFVLDLAHRFALEHLNALAQHCCGRLYSVLGLRLFVASLGRAQSPCRPVRALQQRQLRTVIKSADGADL